MESVKLMLTINCYSLIRYDINFINKLKTFRILEVKYNQALMMIALKRKMILKRTLIDNKRTGLLK